MKQLTIDDVMGSFKEQAKSTSEKFLNPSYEVHFYDKEERQKMDCFDAKTETEAWNATIKEHGKGIQKIRITHSKRTRAEFLALD
ncbi:phage protein [Bacillus anthracis]|nr:phage protein [Bacillus anthracis]